LHEGPAGEGLAGNALWEAEIVLDAGARPRLAPERPALEHDHREPLGGGVDRRGEAGRARADDRDVVRAVGMIDADHAEGARQIDLGGIPEHRAVGADDDRQIGVIRRVVLEQGRRLPIGGRINHAIWAGIAGEESLQAHEVRMNGRPNQDRTAPTRLDQAEPAQEKRAHDPLTEFGLGNQHGSQPVGGNDEHVGVARGAGVHEAGLARQHADFGQEAPGAELDNRDDVAETAPGADGDGTGDEHEHARVDLAGRDDWIAGRVAANRPESPEPVDLLRAEPRKHLIKARVRGGGHREFRWALLPPRPLRCVAQPRSSRQPWPGSHLVSRPRRGAWRSGATAARRAEGTFRP
jgi:hypothetical protein